MAVFFKDWAVICEAIGQGEQDVILRKGGIHEGREGFSFKHEEFYLFPTLFHAQGNMVKAPWDELAPQLASGKAWELGDQVSIKYRCKVLKAETLTDWAEVQSLDYRHIWKEEIIRERFDWAGKGMSEGSIHVAYLKVEVLDEPLELHYEKSMGGCRSWLELPL